MTPRRMALAYRIWCFAEPRGWDCTAAEIADGLDESVKRVITVCQRQNWHRRLRKDSSVYFDMIGPRIVHRTVRSDLSDIIPEWGA